MSSVSKDTNQSRESGSSLPTAWVVDEKSRVRLTPVLQHWYQPLSCQMGSYIVLGQVGESDAVEGRSNHKPDIVGNEAKLYKKPGYSM
jgi:hypothetical protein